MKNYQLVSLLPVCDKTFEGLQYNSMFSFFIENDLKSQNQSTCKPEDSCITRLLSVTCEIYKRFEDGCKVRGVFLGKAFDKVWHQDVMLKLKQNGILENLLKINQDFLSNRYKRVFLTEKAFG